jgi:hypothetical protein
MRKFLLWGGAAIVLSFAMVPTQSQAAAWCGVQMGAGAPGTRDCRYTSFRQCRQEMLAGNRGSCVRNYGYRGSH